MNRSFFLFALLLFCCRLGFSKIPGLTADPVLGRLINGARRELDDNVVEDDDSVRRELDVDRNESSPRNPDDDEAARRNLQYFKNPYQGNYYLQGIAQPYGQMANQKFYNFQDNWLQQRRNLNSEEGGQKLDTEEGARRNLDENNESDSRRNLNYLNPYYREQYFLNGAGFGQYGPYGQYGPWEKRRNLEDKNEEGEGADETEESGSRRNLQGPGFGGFGPSSGFSRYFRPQPQHFGQPHHFAGYGYPYWMAQRRNLEGEDAQEVETDVETEEGARRNLDESKETDSRRNLQGAGFWDRQLSSGYVRGGYRGGYGGYPYNRGYGLGYRRNLEGEDTQDLETEGERRELDGSKESDSRRNLQQGPGFFDPQLSGYSNRGVYGLEYGPLNSLNRGYGLEYRRKLGESEESDSRRNLQVPRNVQFQAPPQFNGYYGYYGPRPNYGYNSRYWG